MLIDLGSSEEWARLWSRVTFIQQVESANSPTNFVMSTSHSDPSNCRAQSERQSVHSRPKGGDKVPGISRKSKFD
jgi:hypothetical protein